MAEEDIYGNMKKYERFKSRMDSLLVPSDKNPRKGVKRYFCINPENLEHIKKLLLHFEARDLSYIRRIRLIQSMKFCVHHLKKNMLACSREDINGIMAAMHSAYKSPKSKETFIIDLKFIWRTLFPEKDEKERIDETLVPYPVRHLSARTDKSRQKLRQDKLSWDEFEKLVDYFSSEPRMQAYLTLALESLARPQELLYLRIKDVELHDNYARIYLSEHGKEGVGLLQCIDSYPYLLKWLDAHPLKKDKTSFLFINTGYTNKHKQLKPVNVNKLIRIACKSLNIDKPITCYSLKRNGVTIRRLRGESDMEIQHVARWTSTKQLKTYDLSTQDEAFKLALEKRGIINSDKPLAESTKTKVCAFCNEQAGFSEMFCPRCKRPLDRSIIVEEKNKDDEIAALKRSLTDFQSLKEQIKNDILNDITGNKPQFKSFNNP